MDIKFSNVGRLIYVGVVVEQIMLLDQGDPGSNYGGVRFLLAHYGGPLIPSEEKIVWFFLTRVESTEVTVKSIYSRKSPLNRSFLIYFRLSMIFSQLHPKSKRNIIEFYNISKCYL